MFCSILFANSENLKIIHCSLSIFTFTTKLIDYFIFLSCNIGDYYSSTINSTLPFPLILVHVLIAIILLTVCKSEVVPFFLALWHWRKRWLFISSLELHIKHRARPRSWQFKVWKNSGISTERIMKVSKQSSKINTGLHVD